MKAEIIYIASARPKKVEIDDVYMKDGLLCIQYPSGLIIKHPPGVVFQVAHMHGEHCGSNRNPRKKP